MWIADSDDGRIDNRRDVIRGTSRMMAVWIADSDALSEPPRRRQEVELLSTRVYSLREFQISLREFHHARRRQEVEFRRHKVWDRAFRVRERGRSC